LTFGQLEKGMPVNYPGKNRKKANIFRLTWKNRKKAEIFRFTWKKTENAEISRFTWKNARIFWLVGVG